MSFKRSLSAIYSTRTNRHRKGKEQDLFKPIPRCDICGLPVKAHPKPCEARK